MGIGSFIKKVGRAVDPTNKNSAFGAQVRTAITSIPGGSAVMGVVDTANKLKGAAKPPPGSPTVAATATGQPPGAALPADKQKMIGLLIVGAAVVAVVLLTK